MTCSSLPQQPPQGTAPATGPDGPQATVQRLAELRGGPGVPQRPLDARALAALAANPGCRRRALLDGAGVDKGAVAQALGSPAPFGQSQFALVRGNVFEARVKADGGEVLLALLCEHTGAARPDPAEVTVPQLTADGPAGRAYRTRQALAEADGWTLLDHPLLSLEVAGSTAYLEPDALAVHPDGTVTIIEIKSFPILDGSAEPVKVGAAARQSAVYALALEGLRTVRESALLVCPKDFSNLPAAGLLPLRKQIAATRRQLRRLTRLEEIAAELPEGVHFAPDQEPAALTAAVESVPAAYAPECLSTCELAFHCRDRARGAGDVVALGRAVRGELGGLGTVGDVLSAASGDPESTAAQDPAAAVLRRAAALRAEALETAGMPRARAAVEMPGAAAPGTEAR
ncbi:nuclease-related domain-containing protein [Streptomyces sp. 3N207]|uniref:nuclease-related domain-containing protein n=1 Tax=Streptomyces sp. 3N207 TaxID=3457417 RepID=UPI003FD1B045